MVFQLFKKKKSEKKEVPAKVSIPTKEQKTGEIVKPTISGFSPSIVRPHVTEKATALVKKDQYIFVVSRDATKIEIKKSVKQLYGVDAQSVRVIHIPPKQMRFGRTQGVKKGYKKAIVKLKAGQKIEVLPR
ncbi:MAG: 50S ribosomal protein L23 [Patescibacteria group bacterium]